MKIDPCRHRDHPSEVPGPREHWSDGFVDWLLIDWLLDPNPGPAFWRLLGKMTLFVGGLVVAIGALTRLVLWVIG